MEQYMIWASFYQNHSRRRFDRNDVIGIMSVIRRSLREINPEHRGKFLSTSLRRSESSEMCDYEMITVC